MRKTFLLLLAFSIVTIGFAQQVEKYNLGLEIRTKNDGLADGWFEWGDYSLGLDSSAYSGNHSGKIVATEEGSSFGAIAYRIPANFRGETIKLRGFIKTENVRDGYAGLLLRVDKKDRPLAFSNMDDRPVTGTSDWNVYEITLPYHDDSDAIYVGGILSGKGKAWFDDFEITIDGQDIQELEYAEKVKSKADLDTEFDNGSGISLEQINPKQIENLALLCRIWGFLKYHHPTISKGAYNWDYELFRILPSYIEIERKADRDALLVTWIKSLNKPQDSTDLVVVPDMVYLEPDFSWIDDQDEELREVLKNVYAKRNSDKHYYVDLVEGVGNPIFENEKPYTNMSYPDDGFRLLSLYRYWNIINYFFPYKYITDKDWNAVLVEYIPLFIHARDELAYELVTLKLITEVNDSHAYLTGATDKVMQWKGRNFPVFQTSFIEGKLVVTDFLYQETQEHTGLRIGDVIHRIDGVAIDDIIKRRLPYYPGSNKIAQLRSMSGDLLRSNKPSITIEYSSEDNRKRTKNITLYNSDALKALTSSKENPPTVFRMLDHDIGYITLETIKQNDVPKIKNEFAKAKGIIIDIRNYPSDFVTFTLGAFFVKEDRPFVKFSIGSVTDPGFFKFTENFMITNAGEYYAGPVVVLVNEQSISNSEYTTMAFQAADRTTVIGSTTAGADGNVSRFPLPGGLETSITGIGVYYPDGTATQRVGIVPDIEVRPTIEGIRAGKDEVLQKAIEFIQGN